MNDKTKLVFAGLLELSTAERQELFREWERYRKATISEMIRLKESYRTAAKRVSLGPLASTERCPCCGR